MCGKNRILALSEDKDIGDSQESSSNGSKKKQVSTDNGIEDPEKRCNENKDQEKHIEDLDPFDCSHIRGLYPA